MESPFNDFFVIAMMILLIGILRRIRRSFVRRHSKRRLGVYIEMTLILEFLSWIAGTLTLIVQTPHPVAILLVILFLGSMTTNSILCYREEKATLNRCLAMLLQQDAPFADALDQIGDTFRSGLAARVKKCARLIERGETEYQSVMQSHLPLDADTLFLLSEEKISLSDPTASSFASLRPTEQADHDIWDFNSQVSHQLLYLAVLLLASSLLGAGWVSLLLPTMEDFSSEAVFSYTETGVVETLAEVSIPFAFCFCLWLLAALLIPKLPGWIIRLIPWFGKSWMDQQRCSVLRCLAQGVQCGVGEQEILKLAGANSRMKNIASRCRKSVLFIDSGVAFHEAIYKAGLIRKNEMSWLMLGSANGNLHHALHGLANLIKRRRIFSWQMRMTWLVPLILILVGIYVLVFAFTVFGFLYGLTSNLA